MFLSFAILPWNFKGWLKGSCFHCSETFVNTGSELHRRRTCTRTSSPIIKWLSRSHYQLVSGFVSKWSTPTNKRAAAFWPNIWIYLGVFNVALNYFRQLRTEIMSLSWALAPPRHPSKCSGCGSSAEAWRLVIWRRLSSNATTMLSALAMMSLWGMAAADLTTATCNQVWSQPLVQEKMEEAVKVCVCKALSSNNQTSCSMNMMNSA